MTEGFLLQSFFQEPAAKDENGVVRDPNTQEIIEWTPGMPRNGVWDMGHIPEEKYADVHAKYMRGEMSKKEFLDWYNDPINYSLMRFYQNI